jgi:nucleoside-diphosphate-sugar epimerase
MAENWIINSGVPYTIIRTGSVFGPGDQFTIPLMQLIKISPLFFLQPGKGHNLLQPLWIDDLINILNMTRMDPKAVNRIFSIGGIEAYSYREIVKMVMDKTKLHRIIVPFSPAYLRLMTLWADQIFPKFPISIFWLDHLAEDRTTDLDSLPRQFGIMPARFHNSLDYLIPQKK